MPLDLAVRVGVPEEVMFEHTPEWRELCGQMEEESSWWRHSQCESPKAGRG